MRQRISILLGSAAVALAAATAALAGTLSPTATISGAAGMAMNLPSSPSLTDTLDGTDHVVSWSALLGIVDARGTGAGWNLTVSATTFSDSASHTLAPGTVTGVSAACVGGNACTAATNAVSYPITLSGTAAKFFNASANTGLGKVNVTPTIDVAIPGNAFAGTYTSTVTLAAVSGP
ncbi:MAG TPA: WxL domain-containing protein [Gaiellaceae bacterium]|nr:WxL domain-containing protein [Gaiellaceae bacterium]